MKKLPVGIDIGGTKMMAVAVDVDASDPVVRSVSVPTPDSPSLVVESIIRCVEELGGASTLGLGLPGLVDAGGVLRAAPNLQCMINVQMKEDLEHALTTLVKIENDATCALFAEMQLGVARSIDDVVLLTLGTGIGGAIAVGGEVHRGAHGFAGEPGHMRVNPNGPLCVCGRFGCWERYASGAGLIRMASEHGVLWNEEPPSGEELARLGRQGDEQAVAVWSEFAQWLAVGLANLADILDPALFVIGGGLVDSADLYLEEARAVFATEVLGGPAREQTRIEPALCGPKSGAIGAALLH